MTTYRCRWDGAALDYPGHGRPPVWCNAGCLEAYVDVFDTRRWDGPVLVTDGTDRWEHARLLWPGAWIRAGRVLAALTGLDPDRVQVVPITDGPRYDAPDELQSTFDAPKSRSVA